MITFQKTDGGDFVMNVKEDNKEEDTILVSEVEVFKENPKYKNTAEISYMVIFFLILEKWEDYKNLF